MHRPEQAEPASATDGIPESSSNKRQVHKPIGGHHPHCAGEHRRSVHHGVQGDIVPGVIGGVGDGVGAGWLNQPGDGRSRAAWPAGVADRPGGGDGQGDIHLPIQVNRPVAGPPPQFEGWEGWSEH